MDIKGKFALVTGGAKRVGRAIAVELAITGADIALHFRSSEEETHKTAEKIISLGQKVELFQADLADPQQIASMFRSISEKHGRLDILINNASIYEKTPIEKLTADQWDRHQAINSRAPALCIRHAIELMKPDGGVIINITDISAEKAWAGFPAYCASKAALLALTKSAAKALADRNIRVNSVAPGVALWQEDISEQEQEKVLNQIPLKRAGIPKDIASAVVFLIQNDYITAQNLRVDGGWHMG